ncbi:AAA family ATPase [Gordonia westfalica]|uniref:AAA family ATPase n=1 Tax=Gordonia westfalica TaxID=158898 RepID=A0ABU2GV02_9ACTN|nr:AAA family ATPase [Gordonia westfalica]MDS1115298.1 AAA family ATPase [Gordonia westfalica]
MTEPVHKLVKLADVTPERVSWLWPGRLPLGKLVTLDGDPGVAKSTLAAAMAAPITTGTVWPDGAPCDHPGAVVWLSAEDGLADTMRPRHDAAGADVNKVFALEGLNYISEDDGERYLRPPTLADIDTLRTVINEVGARLLIVDVLMAYLPKGIDSHKDQDIRRVMSRLSTLADETRCTVLVIRHLNKAKGGDPLYRGGGSIGIVGAARAGLLVARDPDDPDTRVLVGTKSNLAPLPEALTYRLESDEDRGVARIVWTGRSDHDARALLAERDGDDEEGSSIISIIRHYLTECGGKAPAADVLKHTRSAGLTDNSVKKARSRRGSGIATERSGFGKGASWFWSIDSPIDSIDSHSQGTGTYGTYGESMDPHQPPQVLQFPPRSGESQADPEG